MTETTTRPRPWQRFNEHAEEHALYGSQSPKGHTPADSGEWAAKVRNLHPSAEIHEPAPSNGYQSAPYVLFATYDMRDNGRALPDASHPYALACYCEGDVTYYLYKTAADQARALWLLERAL
ncbi:hypothetical protein [Agromyces larvae]|uniref:DUF1963 domain-containing protein n=1 Tax=Agromyces larvae TaxID=2929802 RepID=A0ABY4C7G4_9MICO|nr:hypothetical protein [Agromyces larvae]UOE45943.1 hypothetical protein MTO99_09440 [Agromyces larvae]